MPDIIINSNVQIEFFQDFYIIITIKLGNLYILEYY